MAKQQAGLAWQGNCREIIRAFPKLVRANMGLDIHRLQRGERPHDCRPMKSIGKGVYELRQRDRDGAYRLIYLARLEDTIYMLHAFVKKSSKTSRKDLDIATARLKTVRADLAEMKKNAKEDK